MKITGQHRVFKEVLIEYASLVLEPPIFPLEKITEGPRYLCDLKGEYVICADVVGNYSPGKTMLAFQRKKNPQMLSLQAICRDSLNLTPSLSSLSIDKGSKWTVFTHHRL